MNLGTNAWQTFPGYLGDCSELLQTPSYIPGNLVTVCVILSYSLYGFLLKQYPVHHFEKGKIVIHKRDHQAGRVVVCLASVQP
jgi:hypothetical protein